MSKMNKEIYNKYITLLNDNERVDLYIRKEKANYRYFVNDCGQMSVVIEPKGLLFSGADVIALFTYIGVEISDNHIYIATCKDGKMDLWLARTYASYLDNI